LSEEHIVSCPHCDTSFQVGDAQLQQAGGRVRCGNCLQVFDGNTGEIEFIAPRLPEEDGTESAIELTVKPMAEAELPLAAGRPSWLALSLMLILIVALATQFGLRAASDNGGAALELSQLVLRPHPEIESALRLDAILLNPTSMELPYPSLWLEFSSGHGEPRAQRLFQPGEYLHGDHPSLMPAKSRIQLSLSLQDPGHDAVNYLARLHSVTRPAD
jgi:predicted Zn finger-like uncharacterized protein